VGQASEPPGPSGKANVPAGTAPLRPCPRRLTRHEDVIRSLEDRNLVPLGGSPNDGEGNPQAKAGGTGGGIRDPFRVLLSPTALLRWHPVMEADAIRRVSALREGTPVDLVEDYAVPWSLGVAGRICGMTGEWAERCAPLAREIFLSAALSPQGVPGDAARAAAAELAARLSGGDPGEPGGDPGEPAGGTAARVQAFVALSCTLPALLAGSWLVLLEQDNPRPPHPWLREPAGPLPAALLEELLRLGGPARLLYREAVGGQGEPGALLELDVAAANRDPLVFPSPLRLAPRPPGGAHLALGRGTHACAGAAVVRMALRTATEALFRHTGQVELARPPDWLEGFTIRAPRTLPVVVRRPRPVEVPDAGAP
jgi:cytochrome P450